MTTIRDDIVVFRLSGGEENLNPLLSVGGGMSSYPVGGDINGLFADLSDSALKEGLTDYRCLYVQNVGQSVLDHASIHVDGADVGDCEVLVGLKKQSESQVISVSGPVFFGHVTFSFDSAEFSSVWDGSPDSFASGISSGLDGMGVSGASVSHSYYGSVHRFTVVFGGDNDNKAHPLVMVSDNALEGVEKPQISVSRQTEGFPINSTAHMIATPETVPADADFVRTSSSNMLFVGALKPGDHFPVWVRRKVPPRSAKMQGANFKLRVSGTTAGA